MNDLMIGRVFVRHGSYHYDLGRDENGTRRSKKLSRIVDGEPALYKALAELNADPKATTISDMLTVYLTEGMVEMGLSPRTQHDYCSYAHTLRAWCGDLTPDQLTTSHVAQYLRQRRKAGGRVVANKEIACLSSAYQYGLELGMCEKNPCRGVRRNKTTPRKRYVRDEEFDAILQAVPDYVADFMMGI